MALGVDRVVRAVAGGHEGQDPPVEVGRGFGREPPPHVPGHRGDVAHHHVGAREDAAVEPLVDEPRLAGPVPVDGQERVVDVPAAVGGGRRRGRLRSRSSPATPGVHAQPQSRAGYSPRAAISRRRCSRRGLSCLVGQAEPLAARWAGPGPSPARLPISAFTASGRKNSAPGSSPRSARNARKRSLQVAEERRGEAPEVEGHRLFAGQEPLPVGPRGPEAAARRALDARDLGRPS